jgi:hypothetical protein
LEDVQPNKVTIFLNPDVAGVQTTDISTITEDVANFFLFSIPAFISGSEVVMISNDDLEYPDSADIQAAGTRRVKNTWFRRFLGIPESQEKRPLMQMSQHLLGRYTHTRKAYISRSLLRQLMQADDLTRRRALNVDGSRVASIAAAARYHATQAKLWPKVMSYDWWNKSNLGEDTLAFYLNCLAVRDISLHNSLASAGPARPGKANMGASHSSPRDAPSSA